MGYSAKLHRGVGSLTGQRKLRQLTVSLVLTKECSGVCMIMNFLLCDVR